MRWPWSSGTLDAKKLPADKGPRAEDLLRSNIPSADAAVQVGSAANDAVAGGAVPRPTSIFEFGPLVKGGDEYLRGMCAGDNPDAIQACAWSLEALESKERKPMYRIEF